MNKLVYGYVRVSPLDLNGGSQIIAMKAMKIPPQNIFMDKQSEKESDYIQYRKLLRQLKPGNLMVIKSIDRMGKNYEEIFEQWQYITKQLGADIKVIDMPLLDTSQGKDLLGTFISDLVSQLLSFIAQNEREYKKLRQAEGIAEAKARGVKFGRPDKELPLDHEKIFCDWANKKITTKEAVEILKISKTTFYRKIEERNMEKGPYVHSDRYRKVKER